MTFYHQTYGRNVVDILQNGFDGVTWISEIAQLQDEQDQNFCSGTLKRPDEEEIGRPDFLIEIDIPDEVVFAHDVSGERRAHSWQLSGEVLNRYARKLIDHDYAEDDTNTLQQAAISEQQNGNPAISEKYLAAKRVLDELRWPNCNSPS